MTGQLFVVPADSPEDPYVRLVLELADGRELRFRDIRKFGRIGLYGRDPLSGDLVTEVGGAAVFAAFGPEPLDPSFTVRDFRRRIRRRSGRLKPLLLDQSFLAGVGNIYADEALWAARLHPLRTAGTLRPADERRLYDAIRTVLAEAVERRGSSIDDYTAPDGDGSMQERLQVYQRTGEPCPRCGRPIKRIVVGARSTHFCSWCQRLSPSDRKGAAAILRTMTGGPRRAGRSLDRAGGGGDARADGQRRPLGRRHGHGPSERSGPPRPAGRRRARRCRPSPPVQADEHPAPDRRHPRGRHLRHPRRHRRLDRARRPDRAGRAERCRQDDAAPPGLRSRRAGPRRGPSQAQPDPRPPRPGGPLRRGVHGVAGPAPGGPDRRRPPRPDGRAAGRHGARRRWSPTTPTRSSCTSTRSSAATRSTSGSTAR